MSILLSAYFPEGIVFAADSTVTVEYVEGEPKIDRNAASKVIHLAPHGAMVGFCGDLGRLDDCRMDEWMVKFSKDTLDCPDLETLARLMRMRIQEAFDRGHPEGEDVSRSRLIVHLGGFMYEDGIAVPAMYYISNVPGFDPGSGKYYKAKREFSQPEDHIRRDAGRSGVRNALEYRKWLKSLECRGGWMWYNNGFYFRVFNVLKEYLWQAWAVIRNTQEVPPLREISPLDERIAFCQTAIDLFSSFVQHCFPPELRHVGGYPSPVSIPWPKDQ